MSKDMLHPASDLLEAFVEGSLDGADRAVLESHLVSCTRCQVEVDDLKSLFATLASLPHLVPTTGFADRVMAGISVHRPWPARVAALLRRLIPNGTAGWMLVTAFLSLPVLAAGGMAAWLLSQPRFTAQGLWLLVRDGIGNATLSLAGRAGTALLESSAAVRLWEWAQMLPTGIDPAEVGVVIALFATATTVSAWILYQNLFRSPTREKTYASYCF